MSVPNYRSTVDALFAQGGWTLGTDEGKAAFTRASAWALFQRDAHWGLVRKTTGSNVLGLSTDLVMWAGTGAIVDIATDTGVIWADDKSPIDPGRWVQPKPPDAWGTDPPPPTPGPTPIPYPGDAVWDAVGVLLFADYNAAAQMPNPQMGRWFGRTIWDAVGGDPSGHVLTIAESIAKHRGEWRHILGLPPLL